jgi:AraC family transcriptional regulator of adaptative response / DNA-3-methyladenine glycosylase II
MSGSANSLEYKLETRYPFDWESLIGYLFYRTASGAEHITNGHYQRSVELDECTGWINVYREEAGYSLILRASSQLEPVILPIIFRLRRLFDLDADANIISAHLGELASAKPGLRLPGAFDPFELSVRAILGQLVSVKGACRLMSRFVAAFGKPFASPFTNIDRLTPTPHDVAKASSEYIARAIGIPKTRARAIWYLANEIESKALSFEDGQPHDIAATINKLQQIPGIGEWTAHYIAMHALSWSDAFPHGDLALRKLLEKKTTKAMLEHAAQWSPWRAYAVMHLWNSLTDEN